MSVSLCLMARNEEDKLADCLQSAADLVDEIIVVDTGSTDGTRELAAKLGAKVFEFLWCDHFAAARNECIRHARGEWIFWMDADERIDPVNREKLRALFASLPPVHNSPPPQPSPIEGEGAKGDFIPADPACSSFTSRPAGVPVPPLTTNHSRLTNTAYVMKCLSVQPGETRHGTVVDHVRVFRNRPDIRWKYRVHEQILPALRAIGAEVIFTDIVIQHTGYLDPAFTRQKLERNLRLLHLDHVDHPRDPYILFHLGWGHLELSGSPSPPSPLPLGERGVMEAIAFLRASLDGSQPGDSIVKKLFALLAQAHHRLGQRNEALAMCRAGRARYPEDPELLYLEGIVHRERREWSQAIGCLQKLVGKKEQNNRGEHRERGENAEKTIQGTQHIAEASPLPSVSSAFSAVKNSGFGSADVGLTGYLARHQLALVYYQLGRMAEAEAEWKLALADRPEYVDALKGLGEMYLKQGRYTELDQVVERLGGEKTRNHETHELHEKEEVEGRMLQARGMLARKEYEQARVVLEPMVAGQPGWVYPRVILSHVYLQEGKNLQAAERVLREIVQLDPIQAETWRNLAVLLRQQGRLDQAVEACREGWRHCAHYATLPLLLGITHADKGDFVNAETCLLGVLELPYEGPMPNEHVEARHQLALIYQKTGHPAEAEAQWRTILAERPDYAPAIQALNHPKHSHGSHGLHGEEEKEGERRTPLPSPPEAGGEGRTGDAVTNGLYSPASPRSPTIENDLASIIVLCCNQLIYTRQCLESVLRCTRHPYELILVDNGSTDGTREYLREFKTACCQGANGDDRGLKIEDGGSKEEERPKREVDPRSSILDSRPTRVEIIRNETNLGYPAGCNQALAQAHGRYLVFLNNDVIVTDGWLDGLIAWTTVAGLSPSPSIPFSPSFPVGLVGPVTNCASGPQQIPVEYQDPSGLPCFAARWRQEKAGRALRVDRLTGFCLLVRREVFEQVGKFDEQFGLGFFDDDDLCVRAREAGFQLLVAEDVFVHHFGNRTFRGLGIDCRKQLVSNFERFKNKWGRERAAGYHLPGEKLRATDLGHGFRG